MKTKSRRFAALLLAVCVAAACTGCMTSVDELYSLPQMSEQYVQLQELIAQRIAEGSAYAAPTGGSNRQNVQLRDLDGDGADEALAFLTDETATPTVCVYRQGEGGDYYQSVVITGDGSAVASVDYADLNGDGASELIIAWQISGDLCLLGVYALSGDGEDGPDQLLRADCSDFLVCDLDGDGVQDLLDLRIASGRSTMVLYQLADGDTSSSSAVFSSGVTQVRRAVAGTLSDGTPAIFVESDLGAEGLVTDVFTAANGQLKNITMTSSGRSDTLRPDGIFAADMDGDHALDLPIGPGGDEPLVWYSLDARGRLAPAVSTVYNTEESWYLVLTGILAGGIRLERYGSPDESAIMFILPGDGTTPQASVLIIFAITGENRLDRGQMDGRFVLRESSDTVYAAQLFTDALTQQDIIDNFYLIYPEWQTGDL